MIINTQQQSIFLSVEKVLRIGETGANERAARQCNRGSSVNIFSVCILTESNVHRWKSIDYEPLPRFPFIRFVPLQPTSLASEYFPIIIIDFFTRSMCYPHD